MLHLLLASAFAADLLPTVASYTAHTLRWGEVSLGTAGVFVAPAPQVQVGSSVPLDVLGLPNGRVRVAPLATRPLTLAIETGYTTSGIDGLDLVLLEGGAAISVHAGRLDLHGSAAYVLHDVRGATPLTRQVPAVRDERLYVRGALEIRATEPGRVVATGGIVPWGRSSGAALDHPLVNAWTVGPLGVEPEPREQWWGTLGWQHTAGPLTFRAAVGYSPEPFVWLRDALSVQVRLGPPRRTEADGIARRDEA